MILNPLSNTTLESCDFSPDLGSYEVFSGISGIPEGNIILTLAFPHSNPMYSSS
jgi:hypothetical protein